MSERLTRPSRSIRKYLYISIENLQSGGSDVGTPSTLPIKRSVLDSKKVQVVSCVGMALTGPHGVIRFRDLLQN
jgi:hypothetical protein